jgi:hypothetical protein
MFWEMDGCPKNSGTLGFCHTQRYNTTGLTSASGNLSASTNAITGAANITGPTTSQDAGAKSAIASTNITLKLNGGNSTGSPSISPNPADGSTGPMNTSGIEAKIEISIEKKMTPDQGSTPPPPNDTLCPTSTDLMKKMDDMMTGLFGSLTNMTQQQRDWACVQGIVHTVYTQLPEPHGDASFLLLEPSRIIASNTVLCYKLTFDFCSTAYN